MTTSLLLLRKPAAASDKDTFKASEEADKLRKSLREKWEKENPDWKKQDSSHPSFEILELYTPGGTEAFALAPPDSALENWVYPPDFSILEGRDPLSYDTSEGTIYIYNPREYRLERI